MMIREELVVMSLQPQLAPRRQEEFQPTWPTITMMIFVNGWRRRADFQGSVRSLG